MNEKTEVTACGAPPTGTASDLEILPSSPEAITPGTHVAPREHPPERELDAAFAAFKSSEPGAEERFDRAIRQFAKRRIWMFFGPGIGTLEREDLEQEIVAKVFLRCKQFQGRSRFFTWVFALATNECRMALRDVSLQRRKVDIAMLAQREPESDSDKDEEAEAGQSKAEEVRHDFGTPHPKKSIEAWADLEKLKPDLPEEQHRVVELYLQGHSLEAIAGRTETPIGTVRSRWRLAKEKLREKWILPTR